RSRTGSGKDGELAASKRSSTAVDTLLTFCPPGPDARTKRSTSSSSGIDRFGAMINMTGIVACPPKHLSERSSVEEFPHPRHDQAGLVFQHIVTGVIENQGLRLGQALLETCQEMGIEDKITQAPDQQCRALGKFAQTLSGLFHQRPGSIARTQRDILHEAQGSNAMGPGIVGCDIGGTHI